MFLFFLFLLFSHLFICAYIVPHFLKVNIILKLIICLTIFNKSKDCGKYFYYIGQEKKRTNIRGTLPHFFYFVYVVLLPDLDLWLLSSILGDLCPVSSSTTNLSVWLSKSHNISQVLISMETHQKISLLRLGNF